MKIAFIGHKGYPATYGGIEKVAEELVNRLSSRGHECLVYSRKYYSEPIESPNKNIKRILIGGIRTKRFDTLSHTFLSLIDVIKRDVDIVTIHSYGNSILNFIPKLFGKIVVVHLHGFEFYSKKFSAFERNTILRLPLFTLKHFSDSITSVSIDDKRKLEELKIDSIYIPNGIDSQYGELGTIKHNDKKYFLFVGRIVHQKGIEYLIEAFNKLNSDNYELLIVGDHSNLTDYYNSLIKLANNNPSIKFLGYKYGKELADLYANAYAVVIPSEGEANPMVLLESLSLKKLVIASDIVAIKNVAGDYVLYFENRSSEDLYNKLKYVIENPRVKESFEKRLQENDFKKKYNWENIINKYENLFQNLLEKKTREKLNKKTSRPLL
jgi:glycosyltransferase involved in cell wall biosynthesis